MVELYFENTFYEDSDYIVKLVGTIDSFGCVDGGCYAIRDFKTHSLWSVSKNGSAFVKQEMQSFLSQFELSLQMRFYLFNLQLYALQFPGTEFSKIVNRQCGMFIDGVFISSKSPTQFRRSDVWISKDWEMDELKELLLSKITNFLSYLKSESRSRDGIITGACVDGKFPCLFNKVCAAKDEKIQDLILNKDYIKKTYEPKDFGK